jgi:hypothetical protein
MSNVATFPASPNSAPAAPANQLSEAIVSGIRTLVAGLPPQEQERVLREITEMLRPISAPRAGDVLGTLVRLLPKRRDWTVADLKQVIGETGVEASPKEIYNAIGYLNRKGHIRRVGYGRYVVDGVEVVTADDLGGESSRHEDLYRDRQL